MRSQKTKKRIQRKSKQKSKSSLRSEYTGYQKDSLLTMYFEKNIIFISCRYGLNVYFATVAQLVEQLICNQSVGGSSPLGGS